jgi:hypothetical protein
VVFEVTDVAPPTLLEVVSEDKEVPLTLVVCDETEELALTF